MQQDKQILNLFRNINSWRSGGERAPHKPLLVLLAIGELINENKEDLAFFEIEEKLRNLLIDFGPPRKSYRATYPFIRLSNDNIWVFNKPDLIVSQNDYSGIYLKQNDIRGGFPTMIKQKFKTDQKFLNQVVNHLLQLNFPETIHADILSATDLAGLFETSKLTRDPNFRHRILTAYQFKCAVCNYSIRLSHQLIGVEAAHIKWHQAGGSSEVSNGIALCSMHHKLFDMGAFTVDQNFKINVSDKVYGNGSDEWLYKYNGEVISIPQKTNNYPESKHMEWHVNEVFKGYI